MQCVNLANVKLKNEGKTIFLDHFSLESSFKEAEHEQVVKIITIYFEAKLY